MSKALVADFFPAAFQFIDSHPPLRRVWDRIFPPGSEQSCPRPQISIQIFRVSCTLRWPYASLFCLLGVIIGFSYGATLLYHSRRKDGRRGAFTWSFAFLWYGMMSVGGFFYHCITQNRFFYLMDVISTACSSVSIIAGNWVFTSADDRGPVWRITMAVCYIALVSLAMQGTQAIIELLYGLPAGLAVICWIWFALKDFKLYSRPAKAWLSVALLALLVTVTAVSSDRWFCKHLGSNFVLLFWFFLGCDISLLCLFHFTLIVSKDRQALEAAKHKSY